MAKRKRVNKRNADGLLGMAQSGYESAKKTVGEGIGAIQHKLGSAARSAKRIGSAVVREVSPTKRKRSTVSSTRKAVKTVKATVKSKLKKAKTKVKPATKRREN
jgi:hypothetical protein